MDCIGSNQISGNYARYEHPYDITATKTTYMLRTLAGYRKRSSYWLYKNNLQSFYLIDVRLLVLSSQVKACHKRTLNVIWEALRNIYRLWIRAWRVASSPSTGMSCIYLSSIRSYHGPLASAPSCIPCVHSRLATANSLN